VFTHPNAAIGVISVTVLAIRYDRHRLRLWHLLVAAFPYLLFALAWSTYIIQSPSDFTAQFLSNAAGRSSARWKTIVYPWLALQKEATRHLSAYVGSGLWSGIMSQWMLFVPFIYGGALIWFWLTRKNHGPNAARFSMLTATFILGLTFLNGFKAGCYMIYLVPIYDSVLALCLLTLWRGGPDRKLICGTLATAFLGLQLLATTQHIRADEYHRDYLRAVHALENSRNAGKTILATTAIGMDFNRYRDDVRLGMYTGSKPDVILVDRSYRFFAGEFAKEEPAVFSHVVSTLSHDYRPVDLYGSFWIFERAKDVSAATPWVDVSGSSLKVGQEKAEYFFKILAKAAEPQSRGGRTLP
jgi:hypothetical protein